ncbi:MAG: DUF3300 domain-containing protein [Verrucomicrobia bacterium]|nr:DUF3300 domain-containing protein [Verrucomicrobiota bacterium]
MRDGARATGRHAHRARAAPSAPAQRSAAELEKLAMPIALHPDPLIAILLPASVYPLEIVQAARFVKDTNNLAKLDERTWDANVKAVARIPELIAQMDANLSWTVELGNAFLEQPKQLMDTIQSLRAKAHTAGTLQTTAQQVVTVTNMVVIQTNVTQVVTVTNQVVQVQPANPQVVYVPTYPPTVYYPPPAYVYDPLAPLVTFGVGMAVGAIIANNCDWHGGAVWVGGGGAVWVGGGGYHGDVDIDIDNVNINRGNQINAQAGNRAANTSTRTTQQKWQPDQNRLRSSGAPAPTQTREARGWSGGGTQPMARPSPSPRRALPTRDLRKCPAQARTVRPFPPSNPGNAPPRPRPGSPGRRLPHSSPPHGRAAPRARHRHRR